MVNNHNKSLHEPDATVFVQMISLMTIVDYCYGNIWRRDVNELAYFIVTSLFFHHGNIHKSEQNRIAIVTSKHIHALPDAVILGPSEKIESI